MKIAKFGDIAELIQDRIAPKEDNTGNYIGLENLPSESLLITTWQSDVIPDSDKFLFKKGDVLFARRRAYQKKVGVAPFDGIISTDGMVFRPKPNIYGSLLPFIVKSDHFMNYAINNSAGTMSPRVKWKDLQNCEIKIPENELQKKYSDLLWHLENTIILLNERLTILDQLVKSRFIEMFSACNKVPLTELADITMGQSPDSSAYNDQGIGVPFYQGKTEFTDTFVTVNKYCSKPKKMAKEMDILMSVRAPVGAVNLTSQACCIGRGLAAITPKKDRTDVLFLFNALKTMEQQISDMGVGSTFTAISKDDLMKIKIPVAPVSLQNQFSSFVKQVDKSKFELQKHLDDTKRLQKALINQAFNPKSVQN